MVERRDEFIRARKAAAFTQESLAEAMQVSRETVNLWERGVSEPLPFRRPKLARLLNVHLKELETLLDQANRKTIGGREGDSDPRTTPTTSEFDNSVTSSSLGWKIAQMLAAAIAAKPEHDNSFTDIGELVDAMKRRDLLGLLGATATSAFVSPLLDNLDHGEQERVINALMTPSRVDPAVLHHIETSLFDALRANDVFGPHIAMPTILAQRQIAETVVRDCPPALRPRALSVLSNSLRVAGWVCFNANKFSDARRYYEQARAIAHEAGDTALATFVLGNLAHLADTAEQPALAVDYAVAAVTWANRVDSDNQPLRAFASDMAAIAHAGIGDEKNALTHLNTTADVHLPHCGPNNTLSPFYTYSLGLHTARRGNVQLALGNPHNAHETITKSLSHYQEEFNTGNIDPGIRTNIAVGTVELADLYHHIGDNTQATTTLERVTPFLAATKSPRLLARARKLERALKNAP